MTEHRFLPLSQTFLRQQIYFRNSLYRTI